MYYIGNIAQNLRFSFLSIILPERAIDCRNLILSKTIKRTGRKNIAFYSRYEKNKKTCIVSRNKKYLYYVECVYQGKTYNIY
jgi:hypothetical protein